MQMTAHDIAVAANYLRPMASPTRLLVPARDITAAADALAKEFPDAVHVGFGGTVSRGRLCDSLPDEYITPDAEQTIIVELYGDTTSDSVAECLRAIFLTNDRNIEHPNSRTAVMIVADRDLPSIIPAVLVNRCVTIEIKDDAEALA